MKYFKHTNFWVSRRFKSCVSEYRRTRLNKETNFLNEQLADYTAVQTYNAPPPYSRSILYAISLSIFSHVCFIHCIQRCVRLRAFLPAYFSMLFRIGVQTWVLAPHAFCVRILSLRWLLRWRDRPLICLSFDQRFFVVALLTAASWVNVVCWK